MNRSRSRSLAPAHLGPAESGAIRLDLLVNPFGPSVLVLDALAAAGELHLPANAYERRLRECLADLVGVSPDWLLLANGIDELLDAVYLWRRDRGPLVLFPPADPADERRAALHCIPVVALRRTASFSLGLDLDTAAELPPAATALVGSPNDPTGTLLGTQDAVRLARACELVIVDERHGEYSARTLIPLAREFDNVVVLQTFETWAGLAGFPVAYAIAPPRLLKQLGACRLRPGIAAGGALAALATLDDLAYVRATAQRVRQERSRLYRTLRKLNLVSPYPSWANFLLARVDRGDPESIQCELARRGIFVHRPPHPELARFLRISAGKPDQTDALKQALIEIAATI